MGLGSAMRSTLAGFSQGPLGEGIGVSRSERECFRMGILGIDVFLAAPRHGGFCPCAGEFRFVFLEEGMCV